MWIASLDHGLGSVCPFYFSDGLGWTIRTTSVPICPCASELTAPVSQSPLFLILFNASQSRVTPGPNAYNQNHCLARLGRGKWETGESDFKSETQLLCLPPLSNLKAERRWSGCHAWPAFGTPFSFLRLTQNTFICF